MVADGAQADVVKQAARVAGHRAHCQRIQDGTLDPVGVTKASNKRGLKLSRPWIASLRYDEKAGERAHLYRVYCHNKEWAADAYSKMALAAWGE